MASRIPCRGRNRYREFLAAARTIAAKVSRIDGVIGILAVGGIGRGYCDDFSDLDLTIYVDDAKVREISKYIAVGYLRYKNIELDTPAVSYQKAAAHKSPSRYWSQPARWDHQFSRLLYDTDDRVAHLLKEKLVFPDREQKRLLVRHRGLVDEYLNYLFRLWDLRGDPFHLAHCLVRAAEHIILWIYARHKQFQPYIAKWLFFHLDRAAVPESKYLGVLKKAYVSSLTSRAQARLIRDELTALCHTIGLLLKYENIDLQCARHERNWRRASDKTRHFLSW